MTILAADRTPTEDSSEPLPGDAARPTARDSVPVVVVILGVVAAYAAWRIVSPKASLDWFYDEMWRVDLLRRDDWRPIYVAEATPVTALWFFVLRPFLRIDFFDPAMTRAIAGVLLALGPFGAALLGFVTFRSRWRRDGPDLRADLLAGAGAAGVCLIVGGGRFAAETGAYVNPYLFEAGAPLLVLAWCSGSDRRLPLGLAARGAFVVLGAASIGGLFLVPVIALGLLWRAFRLPGDLRRRELFRHVVMFGLFGAAAAAAYLGMYASGGTRGSTKEFFAEQQFSGGLLDVPGQLLTFVDGALRWNGPFSSVPLLAWALLVIGTLVIGRRQPMVVAALVVGILTCIALSPLTGWPAVAYRVNATIVLGLSAVAAIGLVSVLVAVGQLLLDELDGISADARLGRWLPMAVGAGVTMVVALVNWTPQSTLPPWEFARGLTTDLQPVIESPYEDNLVVTYHYMAKWYTHDRLATGRGDDEPEFELVEDVQNARALYDSLPAELEGRFDTSTAIWCVIPFDVGPEDTPRACRLDSAEHDRVDLPPGSRSNIVLWRPKSS